MSKSEEDALRTRIGTLLAGGLATRTEPIPVTDADVRKIVEELRAIPESDLERRLVVSGFVDHPYGTDQQRCLECMYYLVHRKWCAFPALALPVEADWWCRVWRI